jgi:hypothetical protein
MARPKNLLGFAGPNSFGTNHDGLGVQALVAIDPAWQRLQSQLEEPTKDT